MVGYESLKTKEKSSWVILKLVPVVTVQTGFHTRTRNDVFDGTTVHIKDFTYAQYNDAQIYAPVASCSISFGTD